MIKTKKITQIDNSDWDDLVQKTYNKLYCFQQQDGCQDRGSYYITVPVENPEDYENDTIPFEVNGAEMGVSFKSWLETKPENTEKKFSTTSKWENSMFWDRNFYPHIDMIINDLHSKGLIEAGEYEIKIDW
jgi:hypothetical protein